MAELSPMIENGYLGLGEEESPKRTVPQLVFKNLNFTVGERQILQDVSGVAEAGKLLAIMGPSGSGKTTLLNALCGRIVLKSGNVTLNRQPLDKQLRRRMCYVLQDDIFFAGLTLRETLMFATMMRLPDFMPHEDKLSRLNDIIDALELRSCLDTVIGDTIVRGLSGGEKKRANIACELITDPAIILLDEPTSGLDYSTALSLIQILKKYTVERKKMIITTIHQPSSQIFYQFDKLLLMVEGQMAYFGDSENVIAFFNSVGLPMTEHYNPADFIMEKLKSDERVRNRIVDAAYDLRDSDSWPDVLKGKPAFETAVVDEEGGSPTSKYSSLRRFKQDSMKHIKSSPIYKKVKKRMKKDDPDAGFDPEFNDTGSTDMLNYMEDKDKWPTGFCTQFKQLTIRTFWNSKSRILSKLKLIESLVLCILVSLIWFQLPRTEDTLRDRMGALFFITIHWNFSPLFDAVTSFPSERVVIQKERAAGWYRLSAYYFAKMISELPLIIVVPTVFITVAYWCIGLNGPGPFFGTIFTVMLGAVCGQSIGLFLGILCMDFNKAASIATLIMMAIMLLGGFYTRSLPFWLDWIKYFSFLHYTFHCLVALEFSGNRVVKCSNTANASQFESCLQPNISTISNEQVLEFYGINDPYASYIFPLLFFVFLFRILGYLVLRYVYKPNKS